MLAILRSYDELAFTLGWMGDEGDLWRWCKMTQRKGSLFNAHHQVLCMGTRGTFLYLLLHAYCNLSPKKDRNGRTLWVPNEHKMNLLRVSGMLKVVKIHGISIRGDTLRRVQGTLEAIFCTGNSKGNHHLPDEVQKEKNSSKFRLERWAWMDD